MVKRHDKKPTRTNPASHRLDRCSRAGRIPPNGGALGGVGEGSSRLFYARRVKRVSARHSPCPNRKTEIKMTAPSHKFTPAHRTPMMAPPAQETEKKPTTKTTDRHGFEMFPTDQRAAMRRLDAFANDLNDRYRDLKYGLGTDALWSAMRPHLHRATAELVTDAERKELRAVEDLISEADKGLRKAYAQPQPDEIKSSFRRQMAANPDQVRNLVVEMEHALKQREAEIRAWTDRRNGFCTRAWRCMAPLVEKVFETVLPAAKTFDAKTAKQAEDATGFSFSFSQGHDAVASRCKGFARGFNVDHWNFQLSPGRVFGDFIKF